MITRRQVKNQWNITVGQLQRLILLQWLHSDARELEHLVASFMVDVEELLGFEEPSEK